MTVTDSLKNHVTTDVLTPQGQYRFHWVLLRSKLGYKDRDNCPSMFHTD